MPGVAVVLLVVKDVAVHGNILLLLMSQHIKFALVDALYFSLTYYDRDEA